MRLAVLGLLLVPVLTLVPACSGDPGEPVVVPPPAQPQPLSLEDELAFRRLRQDYHDAATTGDRDLMRSLWADDAVLTTSGGDEIVGADAIADYLALDPNFGQVLVLTSESRWTVDLGGDAAGYGFETIAVNLGGADPSSTMLADGGAQNPTVEIVGHAHNLGIAVRAEDGRWMFRELGSGPGPLATASRADTVLLPETPVLPLEDELGFLRMREQFHLATIIGDRALLRSVWADDAVFRGGPDEYVGGDTITNFMASSPAFGNVLVVTPESSSRLVVHADGTAEYAFECITIDTGESDPLSTELCSAGGTQNPFVQIVRHTHTSGLARRLAEGRWVFQEFNGALGPLPLEPEGP